MPLDDWFQLQRSVALRTCQQILGNALVFAYFSLGTQQVTMSSCLSPIPPSLPNGSFFIFTRYQTRSSCVTPRVLWPHLHAVFSRLLFSSLSFSDEAGTLRQVTCSHTNAARASPAPALILKVVSCFVGGITRFFHTVPTSGGRKIMALLFCLQRWVTSRRRCG